MKKRRNMKYTIEEVIKIVEKNNAKLISNEYINSKAKMDFECKCGNRFTTTLDGFKRGKTRCNDCSGGVVRFDYDYVREYIEKHGCKLVSKEYINCDTPLQVICRECGDEHSVTFYVFKKEEKYNCNQCSWTRTADGQRLNFTHVKYEIEKDGCKLLSKEYDRIDDKLSIRCSCGDVFSNSFAEVKMKDIIRCAKCGIKARGLDSRTSHEHIRKYIEVESKSGCRLISNGCSGVTQNIDIQCGCGEIFTTKFIRFSTGRKIQCNTCSGFTSWDYDMVKEYVLKNSECKLVSAEYINCDDMLTFECECGNHFETSFDKFKGVRDKKQCNECSLRSTLEKKSINFFKLNNITYISEKTFDGCVNPETNYKLRYDFYLPKYNTLIECDGVQHFKPTRFHQSMTDEDIERNFLHRQYLDNIKNEYAKQNNINLVRIPYWELDNIEQVLSKIINNSINNSKKLERAM